MSVGVRLKIRSYVVNTEGIKEGGIMGKKEEKAAFLKQFRKEGKEFVKKVEEENRRKKQSRARKLADKNLARDQEKFKKVFKKKKSSQGSRKN